MTERRARDSHGAPPRLDLIAPARRQLQWTAQEDQWYLVPHDTHYWWAVKQSVECGVCGETRAANGYFCFKCGRYDVIWNQAWWGGALVFSVKALCISAMITSFVALTLGLLMDRHHRDELRLMQVNEVQRQYGAAVDALRDIRTKMLSVFTLDERLAKSCPYTNSDRCIAHYADARSTLESTLRELDYGIEQAVFGNRGELSRSVDIVVSVFNGHNFYDEDAEMAACTHDALLENGTRQQCGERYLDRICRAGAHQYCLKFALCQLGENERVLLDDLAARTGSRDELARLRGTPKVDDYCRRLLVDRADICASSAFFESSKFEKYARLQAKAEAEYSECHGRLSPR